MQAVLRGKGVWRMVLEQEKKSTSDADKQEEWNNKADKACGLLTLRVKQSQRIIFQNVSDHSIKIWAALKAAHIQDAQGPDLMSMTISSL